MKFHEEEYNMGQFSHSYNLPSDISICTLTCIMPRLWNRIVMVSDLQCTEVEVFLDKRVRETHQTAGANSRRGATKKRDISRTLLSINLHFSVCNILHTLYVANPHGAISKPNQAYLLFCSRCRPIAALISRESNMKKNDLQTKNWLFYFHSQGEQESNFAPLTSVPSLFNPSSGGGGAGERARKCLVGQ